MKFVHQTLSLNKIDFEDQTFCLSYPCRASNLLPSIDLVGIIHPPVLRQKEDRYQIVCGRGRLEAARQLGHQEVVCKVLPGWVDDLTCLAISFEENVTTRGFNLVEKALVVEKFLDYLPDEEVIQHILPRLGLAPRYQHLEFLKQLGFLEEEAKELLVAEVLNPQVAVKLLEWDEESRKDFICLIRQLRPSFSRQREIYEILADLARKEEISVKDLIDEEARDIVADERLNPPQKVEKLFQRLRKRLYPTLSRHEAHYQKVARKLAPYGLRLKASPSFEKDSWQIEIKVKKLSELKEKWPEIAALLAELA